MTTFQSEAEAVTYIFRSMRKLRGQTRPPDDEGRDPAPTRRLIDSLDTDTVHIVAHSMGGLVTFRALNMHVDQRVRRVVLMGSPIAGSLSGRRLASFHAGRMLLGAFLRLPPVKEQ